MTLAERYNEAMEHLELSDEARARILSNIRSMDLEAERPAKVIAFPQWKRWAAAAACLAVILFGVFAIYPRQPGMPGNPSSLTVNPVVTYRSLAELSEAIGFDVHEPDALPFAPEEVSYAGISGETAQIRYSNAEQSAVFRKSTAQESSGDYTQYRQTKEIDLRGVNVTIKGDNESVLLAQWQADGFSYSLRFDPGVSEADAAAAVESVILAEAG